MYDDVAAAEAAAYGSPTSVTGGANNLPTVSDEPQGGWYNDTLFLLGSVGRTARDLGTAVGTARRDIDAAVAAVEGAPAQYQTAQRNAHTGNRLGQWFQYATPTDKVMALLAIAGIGVAIWAATRKAS